MTPRPLRVHAAARPSTYRVRFAEAPPAAPAPSFLRTSSFWQMVAVGVTVSVVSTLIISRLNLR